jgi:hypothetical protein
MGLVLKAIVLFNYEVLHFCRHLRVILKSHDHHEQYLLHGPKHDLEYVFPLLCGTFNPLD